jgi:RNA polymerase sigma-70 factor, ECF subfamily
MERYENQRCAAANPFNAEYVQQLREGNASVREHFATYFGELLLIKLRRRLRSRQLIDDVRQETLLRVLQIVGRNGGMHHPERLGALVNSVCNNVLHEFFRSETRHAYYSENLPEPIDERVDIEMPLINEQRRREVKRVLAQLPEKDTKLLSLIFFEERNRSEVCRDLGVDRDYLRILLHRAKARFRERFKLAHAV